uniref:Uncharacterized protein n=1 Tax=Anguilla anguilla TaxID=7936 RepID=A0A0E9UY02_ANGAN
MAGIPSRWAVWLCCFLFVVESARSSKHLVTG